MTTTEPFRVTPAVNDVASIDKNEVAVSLPWEVSLSETITLAVFLLREESVLHPSYWGKDWLKFKYRFSLVAYLDRLKHRRRDLP